jgi:ribonuclease HII
LAKVTRDAEMLILDALYPGYRFAEHKGYPTRIHQAKLIERGASPIHRRSFAPVSKVLSR